MSGHGLNLPYSDNGDDPVARDLSDALLSGGVVILAAAVPLADGSGTHPAIVFQFAKPDGSGFHPPIMLAPDRPDDLRALIPLVRDSVNGAISAARRRE